MPRVPCDWIGFRCRPGAGLTRQNRAAIRGLMAADTQPDTTLPLLGSVPPAPAANDAFAPAELEERLRRYALRTVFRLPLDRPGPPAPPDPKFGCIGCGTAKPPEPSARDRKRLGTGVPAGWTRTPGVPQADGDRRDEYHCPACWAALARPENLARAGEAVEG